MQRLSQHSGQEAIGGVLTRSNAPPNRGAKLCLVFPSLARLFGVARDEGKSEEQTTEITLHSRQKHVDCGNISLLSYKTSVNKIMV